MARPVICGKCKQPMAKGERLKTHWRDKHTEEFIARQVWLGESEAKIRAAILVAGEGMKGAGGQANLGPEYYNGVKEKTLDKLSKQEEA